MKGTFRIMGKKWDNHIMDQGIKKMMRILADVSETDKLLIAMSVGTSDATPDDTTLAALVAEVGLKYTIGSFTVNAVYPFDSLIHNMVIPFLPHNSECTFHIIFSPSLRLIISLL